MGYADFPIPAGLLSVTDLGLTKVFYYTGSICAIANSENTQTTLNKQMPNFFIYLLAILQKFIDLYATIADAVLDSLKKEKQCI